MTQDVEKIVKALISKQVNVPVDKIANDADFVRDLWADSLDFVELSIAAEDAFQDHFQDTQLDDNVMAECRTVQDFINAVKNKIEGKT